MEAVADDVVFRPVWRRDDPQTVYDVRRLWSLAGVPPSVAKSRESEICATAYIGEELAAVSTAKISYDPGMRNNFFGYRCLVAPHVRQRDMAWRISAYSLKLLQEWSVQNPHERILGLMISVETDKFTAGLQRSIREKLGFKMHFVGYSLEGQQLRVVWFDDAMLDDTAALKQGPVNVPRRSQGTG